MLCTTCNRWFYKHCTNLNNVNYNNLTSSSVNFIFKNCIYSSNFVVNKPVIDYFLNSELLKINKLSNFINLQLTKVNKLINNTHRLDTLISDSTYWFKFYIQNISLPLVSDNFLYFDQFLFNKSFFKKNQLRYRYPIVFFLLLPLLASKSLSCVF